MIKYLEYKEWKQNIVTSHNNVTKSCPECKGDSFDVEYCEVCNATGLFIYNKRGKRIDIGYIAYNNQRENDTAKWNEYIKTK